VIATTYAFADATAAPATSHSYKTPPVVSRLLWVRGVLTTPGIGNVAVKLSHNAGGVGFVTYADITLVADIDTHVSFAVGGATEAKENASIAWTTVEIPGVDLPPSTTIILASLTGDVWEPTPSLCLLLLE